MRVVNQTISTKLLPVLVLTGFASATTIGLPGSIHQVRPSKLVQVRPVEPQLRLNPDAESTVLTYTPLQSTVFDVFNANTDAVSDAPKLVLPWITTQQVKFVVREVGTLPLRLVESIEGD